MKTRITKPCIICCCKPTGYMMTEKICTGCKILKELDEFGNDKKAFDGKNQKCKKCCKERAKKTIPSQQAILNKKKYQSEWQKKRRPILNAKYRDYYKENIEKMREQGRERTKRHLEKPEVRKQRIKYMSEWKKANWEKYTAHQIVRRAVKSGKINKPEECQICKKKSDRIEGHHEDYNKPLEVIWMCSYCHLYHHQSSRFHAERTSEKTSKEDAMFRTPDESGRVTQK